MVKKVIIFDMDGTLIDSVGIWNQVDEALISAIRKDGKLQVDDVQWQRDCILRKFSSDSSPYISYCAFLKEKYLSEMSAEDIHTLRYEIAQNYLENVIDYKDEADEFVKLLKKQGYQLCIYRYFTERQNTWLK